MNDILFSVFLVCDLGLSLFILSWLVLFLSCFLFHLLYIQMSEGFKKNRIDYNINNIQDVFIDKFHDFMISLMIISSA